ncbi:hypothetical protein DICSQDRAFT_83777 [Dichomitus squalens LYAD-421 SS1]|uniref:Mitochondrial protein n=1 Tax=Dichomitus squalens TaxID=114155 RepID=A0A4Q9MVV2_9APHY|nr:uncharacterized protein DICSQDRAFT_83777 [Dichomitus squalens LYAD-421 SS1]EJF62973.1 hypothetical protein DICSQDRAFT_83777 [Dichomitus squalens LYAD-421 SS1]TBU32120.1 hypothetical protein BD311DRAFT_751339 [Dichomitus squalens]
MVKHLPPTVKQLLTLRNPQPRAAPQSSRLNAVLTTTYQDAKAKKAEKGWLTLATCTLLTANAPPAIGHLYRFATRDEPDNASSRRGLPEALDKAALMRESALKSCIFVGVPRTILSLANLHEAIEDDVKAGLRKAPSPKRAATPENVETIVARGRGLWATIYEPHAEKLYNKLGGYHPDFIEFIIQAYGTVLAPLPGGDAEQGNLSRALGSVVGTACLRAEGGVGPQLVSHVFGLLKARHVQGLSAEDYWLASDEGTEWVVRTVDSILDVVKPELGDGTAAQAKL